MKREIGEAFKEAFDERLETLGQTILVHDNFDGPNRNTFHTRGVGPSGTGNEVSFSFPKDVPISVGNVLQLQGGRDYWRVIDTEDKVKDDVYISFDVRTIKISAAGSPVRQTQPGGTNYYLQGVHSRVNISSQDNSINVSSTTIHNLFESLREAISTNMPAEEMKAELLAKVNEMEEAKGTPSFLDRYKEFISIAADHIGVISAFIPGLSQLLGG